MVAQRKRFVFLVVIIAVALAAAPLLLWRSGVGPWSDERTLAELDLILPRADDECREAVRTTDWEPRPENEEANQTVPEGPVDWNVSDAFPGHVEKVVAVTGNFTGTTDEIIQWAACKWGIDVDLVRSLAVKESYWRQGAEGDHCGDGEPRSYGILQVRHAYCDGRLTHGGHPWTARSTALNVDFVLSFLRACIDGDFYDGGPWLYGGEQVRGDVWGCVGTSYSGRWYDSGAVRYADAVRRILGQRPWLTDARFYGRAGPLPQEG